MPKLDALQESSPFRLLKKRLFGPVLTLFLWGFFAGTALAQTVVTDKDDYRPGDIVTVTGTGWQPGETVQLVFTETPLIHPPDTIYAIAGGDGNFYNTDYEIEEHDLGQFFTLVATGLTSGLTAQTTFTDGNAADGDGLMTVSPVFICNPGTGLSYTFTFDGGNGNKWNNGSALTIAVPWTITSSNVSVPIASYVNSPVIGTITTSPLVSGTLVTIPFYSLSNAPGFNIVISGTGVDMPANTIYTIPVQTKQAGGALTDIGAFPKFAAGNGAGAGKNGVIFSTINSCGSVANGSLSFYGTGTFVRWESRAWNAGTLTWGPWSTVNGANSTTYNLNSSFGSMTQFRVITTGASCGVSIGGGLYESEYYVVGATIPTILASNITSYGVFNPPFGEGVNVTIYSFTATTVKYFIGGVGGTEIFSGHVFPASTTTVTVQAINTCGTSTATFDVITGIPPQIDCPTDVNIGTDEGVCSANVTYSLTYLGGAATATTGDGTYIGVPEPAITYSWDGANFNPGNGSGLDYPKGTTTVTLKASSAAGEATCSFTVTVNDDEAPKWVTAAGALDVTLECDDAAGLSAAQAAYPVASDNCDADVTDLDKTSGSFAAGACAQAGTYTNTWTVTDESGNTSEVFTQVITIIDTNAPTWTTAANALDVTLECDDAAGLATAQAAYPVASDNCDADVTSLDKTSGSFVVGDCPQAGSYTNTWTVTDDCGNTSAVFTQVITIVDTKAPTWTTAAGALDVTLECDDAAGLATAQAAYPVASDNCDADVTSLDKTSGSFVVGDCPQAGSYTNTWTVTDDCGNTSAVFTQVITIIDTKAPTFDAPDDITQATDAGECYATVTITAPTPADNCDASPTIIGERSDGQLLTDTYPFGTTTITWTATDACGNTSDPVEQKIIIDKITPVVNVSVVPSTQQYSDYVTITAIFYPPQCTGSDPICGDVTFKVGNEVMGTGTISIVAGVASASWTGCLNENGLTGNLAPGTKDITAEFPGCGDFAAVSATAFNALTITQEDADGEYIGLNFAQTSCATCDKAKVTLSATIWDLQSTNEEDDADGCGGDIRNALVRFIVEPTGGGSSYTSPWLPVGLIDPNDPLRGTATVNGVELTEDSYTVTVEIGGYYKAISEIMSTLVISKPMQTDFITGGGYVIPTNSNGLYATNYAGSKTNFGFNIKYNKSGKKLQGNFNLIFRRKEGGEIKTYQIKGTTCATLTVDNTQTKATFSGKGNLAEIIDGVPYGIQGGATLIVDVTDNGEPGTGKDPVDMIAVSLLNKNGGLLYSTNWVGTKSEQMLLDGGNIQVNGSRVTTYAAKKIEPDASANQLDVRVINNPSTGASAFRIQLLSNDKSTPIMLKVVDINGRSIETQKGLQHGTVVEIGRSFTSGMYLLEAVQGDQRKLIKLIKQ